VQLRQLLQNLIVNALKFGRPGVPAQVQISSAPHGAMVEIVVADNGVGIPAHLIAGPASFGLLSMKERALMLGGTVDVMSGPGAGTKIVVRVPHAAREDEAVQP